MKTYDSKSGRRRIWYDTSLRLWTLQTLDGSGYQAGEVDYEIDRIRAFGWLNAPGA